MRRLTALTIAITLLAACVLAVPAQESAEDLLPTPGEWIGVAEFGEFAFTVNEDSDAIVGITYHFSDWECDAAAHSGTVAIPEGHWPIEGGEFTIQTKLGSPLNTHTMTITGAFEGDSVASGVWTIEMGETCSGEWVASAEQGALAPIDGDYVVVGTNPDGSEYEGTLEITRTGDIYEFVWEVGITYYGVGILQEDVVSVAWGANYCGVASYRLQEDGALDGLWAYMGQEELAPELAVPNGEFGESIEGIYAVTGANPDGTEYEGRLSVTAYGDVYEVAWQLGDTSSYYGTGIWQGDVFSVVWGDEDCGIASYIILEDGALDGVWTYIGQDELATEQAVPGIPGGDRV